MLLATLTYKKLLIRFCSISIVLTIFTFSAYNQNRQISFQTLQEGLSHPWVMCTLKDSQSFMWFGTHDGLNKFDGTNFIVYEHDPADTNSISFNSINTILEDRNANIWVGTSKGLNLYNREKDNFTTIDYFGNDLFNIRTIYCDNENNLWIGTAGRGLLVYNPQNSRIKHYTHDDKDKNTIASRFINCIISDDENNLWIGTRAGLDLFNKKTGTFIHFAHDSKNPKSLSNNTVNALAFDKEGELLIGTYGGGINKLIKKDNEYIFSPFKKSSNLGSINHNNILSLCADTKGNLWVGTENGGLRCLCYQSDEFIDFFSEDGNPKSLGSNSIWSIYEDDIGIIWIGTFNKGLNIIDEKHEKFELIQRISGSSNTLANNNVRSFSEDAQGNLWIATDGGGVSCFNLKSRQFIDRVNNSDLTSKAVMSVLFDSKQNLWLGTWTGGIERFNKYGKKIKNYKDEEGLGFFHNIICLYEDRKGNILAGTAGRGLYIYDKANDSFKQFPGIDKTTVLSNRAYINAILEDHNNNLWVGTSYGLACMEKKNEGKLLVSEYLHAPGSNKGVYITCIFEDSKNHLWIGTLEGLYLFNSQNSTFTIFLKQDGLPNNKIMGILEDINGNLWISSNKGISKFNTSDKTFENFAKEDGLNSNAFNPRACIKTSSGELFYGGNNGMNAFFPDSIKLNTIIPPVYLTKFKIFNNPVKIGTKDSPLQKHITESSEITLTYKQNSFTIEYVALNYTRSEKNQYAYILEGFDPEESGWNFVGNKQSATYTNLGAGKYIFKVAGSNNDKIWNDNPTELLITVLPPYWKTVWAYLLYFLIFSSVLFGFVRLLVIRAKQAQRLKIERMNHEKDEELNREKTHFFTNISHELRTPLSLISTPLEQIITTGQVQGELKNRIKLVFRNVEKLNRLVNELMDFTKSEESRHKLIVQKGDIVKFAHEVYFMFMDEAKRREIDYSFVAEKEEINAWFDGNKMEKIILNLISNSFKYTSDQGKILLKVEESEVSEKIESESIADSKSVAKKNVKISVIDNGSGISSEYQEKVFERYFQNPENDIKSQSGTGIGLALAKQFIELHHGNIQVKSDKWKETCFSIDFPLGNNHYHKNEIVTEPIDINSSILKPNDSSELTAQGNQEYSEMQYQILVVEDNTDLREYIVSTLSVKYKVLEAADGDSGYDIAMENTPDLIISDILMPKITGIELCEKLKQEITTSHIPVILLTAKATIEDQIEGIETGADMYITKPFNINYLEVTIKNLIETRKKLFQRFSQEAFILPKEISSNTLDQRFLGKAVEYINMNVASEEITVESLASYLTMNRSNVYRKIKALTGQTATEFIRTVKLKMAIKYFKTGDNNISEIAFKTGFDSPGYFTKCFKKQFGTSPSEFLEKQKQEK